MYATVFHPKISAADRASLISHVERIDGSTTVFAGRAHVGTGSKDLGGR